MMKIVYKRVFSVLVFCFGFGRLLAQFDTLESNRPQIKLSAFLDIFYCYDFNKPQSNYRQPFLYNHNRHNEFNINLGFVKVSVEQKGYMANLALQTGTYANDNYASEPGTLKNIYEANAGIKLGKGLWLDAGVFSSHLGFEGAVSIDYPTLTRSLVAEGSPYYLAGVKLTHNPNTKWELGAVVSNGWQRIQRVAGNSLPCFGTQVKYFPNSNTLLNWSTLIGTDDPDSTRRMRYFNNLYAQFQLNDDMNLTLGFDAGMQQQSKGSSSYNTWYAPVVVFGYKITEAFAAGFRAEYFEDEASVVMPTGTNEGFNTTGISLNLDYRPAPEIACRIEGRYFDSKEKIFAKDGMYTDRNFVITGSIAVKLEHILTGKR